MRGEGKRGPVTSLGQQVSPITNLYKNSIHLKRALGEAPEG